MKKEAPLYVKGLETLNRCVLLFFLLGGLWLLSASCKGMFARAEVDCAGYELDGHEYFTYVPSAYRQGKALPLLVAIHGSGLYKGKELGGEGMCKGMRRLAEKYDMILVCPSLRGDFPIAENGSGKIVAKIIRHVSRKYKIRYVSLYGFSAGAEFVERLAFMEPEMFRAVVCMDGGSDFNRIVPRGKKMPGFLFMIDAKDLPRRVRQSEEMAGIIRKARGLADFELIPNLGHAETEQVKERAFSFALAHAPLPTGPTSTEPGHERAEETGLRGNLEHLTDYAILALFIFLGAFWLLQHFWERKRAFWAALIFAGHCLLFLPLLKGCGL